MIEVRQRQVDLGKDDQTRLVIADRAGDTVQNLAIAYRLHRGTVSEILTRRGVTGRTHGPRRGGS